MKGTFEIKGLEDWIEEIAKAGEDVDEVVAEALEEVKPEVDQRIRENLKRTSEQWTGETDGTIEVSGPEREGNYTFIEASAGGHDAPQAYYKEFGTTRQAAEPFLRTSFAYLRRYGMKKILQKVLDRIGRK